MKESVWKLNHNSANLSKNLSSVQFFQYRVFLPTVGVMERWCASQRSEKVRAAMTECFLPPSSSPAEQRRAEHPGGVARTPSSEEISPTKFPGLYRTGEPSPPHDGHHHEPPDAYVSDDDKEHSKKKNKFKKKEKRSKIDLIVWTWRFIIYIVRFIIYTNCSFTKSLSKR